MTNRATVVLGIAVLAAAFPVAGCAKRETVTFAPFDAAAISSAKVVEKPVLIYATADW
jgi:hypothetical protein